MKKKKRIMTGIICIMVLLAAGTVGAYASGILVPCSGSYTPMKVTKEWKTAEGTVIPDKIYVGLKGSANGEDVVSRQIRLYASRGWKYEMNQPDDEDRASASLRAAFSDPETGEIYPVRYRVVSEYVKEDGEKKPLSDYDLKVEMDETLIEDAEVITKHDGSKRTSGDIYKYSFRLTNVDKSIIDTDISGKVIWKNDTPSDRPEKLEVKLSNGETAYASAESEWTYRFSVPKYDQQNNEAVYNVSAEAEGYTSQIDGYDIIMTASDAPAAPAGTDADKGGGDAPGTGDADSMMLWIILAAAALAGAGTVIFRKHHNNCR